MFKNIVLAHHIGVEIMGHEYEPHGALQHILCIVITAVFFTFAVYGFKTFVRKFLPARKEKLMASHAESSPVTESK